MKIKGLLVLLAGAALVSAAAILSWPGNYYVHRALWHTYPKIDQYPIFENRVVKAGKPAPMAFAPGVSERKADSVFEDDFARYGTVAYLVLKDGKIFAEQYWEGYGKTSRSNSFSMAKSIVSLLTGCAIRDGFIESVDQPVSDFLPQWQSFEGRPLLIRDLLTMSAGVKWDESATSLFSTTTEAYYGKDLWRLTQSEVLTAEPGKYFNYQSGVTQILAFLLKKATGKNIADYASEKIWTPIGAEEDALWSLDRKDGMEKAYCCFNSNARDFARLGQLVLQDGYWNTPEGRISVVDSAYVAQATSPASYLKTVLRDGREAPCTMYGFQFWLMNYKGHEVKYFRGILGQYIMVIPDLDAVIVRLGHRRAKEYDISQDYPLDMEIWLEAGLRMMGE